MRKVRRRWLILLGILVCVLASWGYESKKSVFYRVEASVLPSQERDLEVDSRSAEVVRRSDSYMKTLKSPSTMRSMLERTLSGTAYGLPDSVRLRDYFGGGNIKLALDRLASCAEFTQEASGVITVAVILEDPLVAAAVANAFVEELIIFYAERQQKQAREDLEFIQDRMKSVEVDLKATEDSLVAFQRANVAIQDPALAIQYSHLKRQVDLRSNIYSTLANQYELARIDARREAPTFEVLIHASPDDAVAVGSTQKTVGLSAAVGLFVSVFLAFVLEYVQRNRQSGRLEPILDELKTDVSRARRLFGKEG